MSVLVGLVGLQVMSVTLGPYVMLELSCWILNQPSEWTEHARWKSNCQSH